MKLGLTLPSFRESPEPALAVARAAESASLDAVFAYDHLFRRARDGAFRPALECTTLLGAVATETSRIALGPLAARATLRPPATLATALDTVARIAPHRLLVTIGSGDSESREENESFGLGFGTFSARLQALATAVDVARGRGYPVWVGGNSKAAGSVAVDHADGWNQWGTPVERFAREVEGVRRGTVQSPFTLSWGGLFVLGVTDREADEKRVRLDADPLAIVGGPERVAEEIARYREAGAEWVMVGPVDSSDPDNAAILGELVKPLLD